MTLLRDDDLMTPAMRACRRALIVAHGWAAVIVVVAAALDAVRDDVRGATSLGFLAATAWICGALITAASTLTLLRGIDRSVDVELRQIASKVQRLDDTDAA